MVRSCIHDDNRVLIFSRDGWSSAHNSWEPGSELKTCAKIIAKFLCKFVPSKLRFKSQNPVSLLNFCTCLSLSTRQADLIAAFYEEGLCWLKQGITKQQVFTTQPIVNHGCCQVTTMETAITDRYNLIIKTIRAKGLQQEIEKKVVGCGCSDVRDGVRVCSSGFCRV